MFIYIYIYVIYITNREYLICLDEIICLGIIYIRDPLDSVIGVVAKEKKA